MVIIIVINIIIVIDIIIFITVITVINIIILADKPPCCEKMCVLVSDPGDLGDIYIYTLNFVIVCVFLSYIQDT